MATHLHVMPMKACLQLDLQRKSDISAHCSTSPGGRGLEGRETEREREADKEGRAVKAERDREESRLRKQANP